MKSKLFFLICFIPILACHKDSETVIRDEEQPDPPSVIVTTRLVTIADTTFEGFDQATQTFANQAVYFDHLPFQQIKGTGINRDYELVRLTTAEGFDLYHVQNLIENDVNYLHWTYPSIKHYSGNAGVASTYNIAPGSSIIIPENSMKNDSGETYLGPYELYVSFSDPGQETAFAIPSYTGINQYQKQVSLFMNACYYVSALTPDRKQLSFTDEALIKSESHDGGAWYFDPEMAVWKTDIVNGENETNEIRLQASGYYALAAEMPQIRIEGSLQINALPAPHYPVSLMYEGQVRRVFTTNSGRWALHVPAATTITATFDLPCDQKKEITFNTTNEEKQQIPFHIQSGEIINVHLTGSARDCWGQPLSNHLIWFTTGKNQWLFEDQSDLSLNIAACTGQLIGIKTLDLATGQLGPEIFWPTAPAIDISSSFGCEQAQGEYLLLNVDGNQKMYWDLQSAVTPQDRLLIQNGPAETELDLQLLVTGMTTGSYEDTRLNIAFEDRSLGTRGYSLYCPTSTSGCGFTEFNITHFPDQTGQWIRGRFKGNFWIKTFHPLTAGYRPVEGEFQVYRDF